MIRRAHRARSVRGGIGRGELGGRRSERRALTPTRPGPLVGSQLGAGLEVLGDGADREVLDGDGVL